MKTHSGGCHCGKVRFSVEAPARVTASECNCSICRMTGFLHLIVPAARFRLLQGADTLTSYTFGTGVAKHLFCRQCGIKSFYVPRSNPDGYSVNLRCLDEGTIEHVDIAAFDGQNWERSAHALAHLSRETAEPVDAAGAVMNDHGSLAIRACIAADAMIAVPLIHDSGPIAFRYVFSQRHEAQSLEFLRAAFGDGHGEFGFRNHVVAERAGEVVGVAALWDARANLRFTIAAARQILGFYRASAPAVILRGLRMERVVKPALPGVAYIGHVAVAPALRGQGVGRALLVHLLARVRGDGFARAALDVAATNPRARALYEGLGFRVVETRGSALRGRWGSVPDHHYMELDLGRWRGGSPGI